MNMNGPSLFDDFFAEEDNKSVEEEQTEEEISIHGVKEQLAQYEKEKQDEFPEQEPINDTEEEQSDQDLSAEEKTEDAFPNPASESSQQGLALETPTNPSIHIEWGESQQQHEEVVDTSAHVEENIEEVIEEKEAAELSENKKMTASVHIEIPNNAPQPIQQDVEISYQAPEEKLEEDEKPSSSSDFSIFEDIIEEEKEEPTQEQVTVEKESNKDISEEIIINDIGNLDLNTETLPDFEIEEEEEYVPEHISGTKLPAWELDKLYYPIGDVAKLFEVNVSHIRYWTNEFNLKPRTTRRGERLYTPEEIQKLRMIYFLVKEQNHTIKGAKQLLKKNTRAVADQMELKDALTDFKNQLEDLVKQLGED